MTNKTTSAIDLVERAIAIVENGEVDVVSGLGTFSADERDIILRALKSDTITRLQAALDEIAGAPLYRTRTGNERICLAEHTRDIARKAVGGE